MYLKRAGIDPLVLERKRVGGLLVNANLVENYPGFPEGICGWDLVSLFQAQLRRWRIRVTKAEVRRISRRKGIFRLNGDGWAVGSRYLIVATGTCPKKVSLPGLDALPKKRVLYEIADAPRDIADRRFLVIGGGDAAIDSSLAISEKGGFADVIFRSSRPSCLHLLRKRAEGEDPIRLHPRTTPVSCDIDHGRVVLRCRRSKAEIALRGDYLLISCGREANLPPMPARLRRESIDRGRGGRTRGVFLVGDVRSGLQRQVGIAVGDGIAAAMTVATELDKEGAHEDTR